MTTILLVEDERPIALLLQELLEDEGYEVVCAGDGREALQLLSSSTPDLIITDVMMPVMDGLQMSRAIRSDPRYESVPIVLMSAARKLKSEPDFNFSAFIAKPFELEHFLSTVRTNLPSDEPA